jgi:hypothetical protein
MIQICGTWRFIAAGPLLLLLRVLLLPPLKAQPAGCHCGGRWLCIAEAVAVAVSR